MALPDLHRFQNDLLNRPAGASNAPPRTIRARDLDENFLKVTLIESDQEPPLYELEYTKDGVRLTRLLPIPPASGTHVLGAVNGEIQWIGTEDC